MQHSFWQERWQQNQIGFHNPEINQHLKHNWSLLNLKPTSKVFVPLCGKSNDLLWLYRQGYQVIGVELSRIAAEAFFTENQLPVVKTKFDEFELFESDGIQIYCGDFFALPVHVLNEISAVYDRASLVALPSEMREQYVSKMKTLLPENTQFLLVTFTYPQHEMQAPPFSVDITEVKRLFDWCEIKHLYGEEITDKEPHFKARGVSFIQEDVYLITH